MGDEGAVFFGWDMLGKGKFRVSVVGAARRENIFQKSEVPSSFFIVAFQIETTLTGAEGGLNSVPLHAKLVSHCLAIFPSPD